MNRTNNEDRPSVLRRRPTAEGVRRSDNDGAASSDRPGSSSSSSSSSARARARFHPDLLNGRLGNDGDGDSGGCDDDDDDVMDSVANWIVDLVLGAAAAWISLGFGTVVVLLYAVVRPFSVPVYRRLVNRIGTGSYLEAVALLLPNTKICLTGDSDVPNPVGTSILVSNHVANADWYGLLALGRCVGLKGSIKVFLRNEIFRLNKTPTRDTAGATGTATGTGTATSAAAAAAPHGVSPMRRSASLPSTTGALTEENHNHNLNHNHNHNHNSTRNHGGNPAIKRKKPSPDLALAANFFHSFLEFPLIDEEGYVSDRESLFKLLRSFAGERRAAAPVHFVLFPEGWSLYNGESRNTVLARSNDFAKRERRPQLKHLLLPRTTGFNASISSLRESSPVIYDITVAYRGYRGCVPPEPDDLSLLSLWHTLRRKHPEEVHVRIKRYSMEEVLRDASWLDKKWAEKDRTLQYFSRHACFPTDSRGFCRHQLFETRFQSLETSVASFLLLSLLPWTLPVLFFLSIPILWTTFVAWLIYKSYRYTTYEYSEDRTASRSPASNLDENDGTPGNSSRGTPFIPTTPFASPSISIWHHVDFNNIRDSNSNSNSNNNK